MDYQPFDSSGTDDDLPPSNRIPRGGRATGNGKPCVPSAAYPRMYSETDMEIQIHQLEKEAYISVLRAFKAQADAITWEKEGLITELRKELRLSNEEHRELLPQVNADDRIRRIREWRQSGGIQSGVLKSGQAVHDTMPSPTVSATLKKQKTNQSIPSKSFGGPSPSFHAQAGPPHQPSSAVAKRASLTSSKRKKHKSDSSMKATPYLSSDPTGRGQVFNRVSSGAALLNEPAEGAPSNPLIGRRVRTRWPDDNTFYEAVITEYNPVEWRHALVYDIGTANETWEWINLSEISPEDIEWIEDDPGISHRHQYDGSGHGINRSVAPNITTVKGRGSTKNPVKKDFRTSHNGIGKKKYEDMQIRRTDILIREVERVFGEKDPDPREIEEAKRVLEEHEQALVNAIAKLVDISDGESVIPD